MIPALLCYQRTMSMIRICMTSSNPRKRRRKRRRKT
jgi:hypothetical protein